MTQGDHTDRLRAAAPAGAAAAAVGALMLVGGLLTREDMKHKAGGGEPPAAVLAGVETPPLPLQSGAPQQADSPGVVTPAQAGGPAAARAMDAEIVVKFEGRPDLDAIARQFWKDPEGARTKFEAFQQQRPEFRGLVLDRVTYSDELVLKPGPDAPAPQRVKLIRELAEKLRSVPDISYAEPNFMAHPGDQ